MVYVFLAEGFEEVEALTPVDVLRRCGVNVATVGVGSQIIRGSHGISVMTDTDDGELTIGQDTDMIILPGGMPGTLNLEKCPAVKSAIEYCLKNDKLIAAICAAPSVLGHMGVLKGKNATCFPGFEDQLTGAHYTGELVVVDGKIITAKGPGAAMRFAFTLAEILCGKQAADKVEDSMQCS